MELFMERARSSIMAHGTAESVAATNLKSKSLESWWHAKVSLRGADGFCVAKMFVNVFSP